MDSKSEARLYLVLALVVFGLGLFMLLNGGSTALGVVLLMAGIGSGVYAWSLTRGVGGSG